MTDLVVPCPEYRTIRHEGKIDQCEAGDTSSATTLRGKFPQKWQLEKLDLIENTKQSNTSGRCASCGEAHLFYGSECSIGLLSLEPNELCRKRTEELQIDVCTRTGATHV